MRQPRRRTLRSRHSDCANGTHKPSYRLRMHTSLGYDRKLHVCRPNADAERKRDFLGDCKRVCRCDTDSLEDLDTISLQYEKLRSYHKPIRDTISGALGRNKGHRCAISCRGRFHSQSPSQAGTISPSGTCTGSASWTPSSTRSATRTPSLTSTQAATVIPSSESTSKQSALAVVGHSWPVSNFQTRIFW